MLEPQEFGFPVDKATHIHIVNEIGHYHLTSLVFSKGKNLVNFLSFFFAWFLTKYIKSIVFLKFVISKKYVILFKNHTKKKHPNKHT